MTKPLNIGLTGGIGSGKSLIANFFRLLSIPVYISDFEAKHLMQTDKCIRKLLTAEFGTAIYLESGELNRPYLAQLIFNDQKALNQVNAIVHPRVRLHYQKWMENHHSFPYVIQESAILFDTGLYKNFDRIITVSADDETRIKRVVERDKCSIESVLERMSKQMPEKEKIAKSDFVIYNNGDLVIPQIIEIHKQLLDLETTV